MSIQLHKLTHSAQAGGYWLISGELLEPLESVYAVYSLPDTANPPAHQASQNQQACLFDYQFPKLQLLTKQPIDAHLLEQDSLRLTPNKSVALSVQPDQPTLLLASDLGIGPLFYCARNIKQNGHKHLALLHASQKFPFMVKPAQFMLSDFPFEAIGGCSLLEDWKIANRLASDLGQPGCLEGSIIELITPWLEAENQRQTAEPINWQVISFLPENQQKTLLTFTQNYAWLSLTNYAV